MHVAKIHLKICKPERENEGLSTIDCNTLNAHREESQTTETQETVPQEVGDQHMCRANQSEDNSVHPSTARH